MCQENKTLFYCNTHAAIAKLTSKAEVHQKKHPPETSLGLTHFLVWLIWLQNKNHLPRTKQQRRKRNLKDQRSLIKLRKWNSPRGTQKRDSQKKSFLLHHWGLTHFLVWLFWLHNKNHLPGTKKQRRKKTLKDQKSFIKYCLRKESHRPGTQKRGNGETWIINIHDKKI